MYYPPLMQDVSNSCLPDNTPNSNVNLHKSTATFTFVGFQRLVDFALKYHLKYLFSTFCARIWSSIPQSVQVLLKHKFKASLHQLLLHILELEDTYVDTPSIINKLSKMTRMTR